MCDKGYLPFNNLMSVIGLSILISTVLVMDITARPIVESDSSGSGDAVNSFYQRFKIPPGEQHLNEFSFWGGYSFKSTKGIWGKISGAELGVLGLRYNRKLMRFPRHYLLKYVLELNIHAYYQLDEVEENLSRSSISGFGLAPIGFQLNYDKHDLIQPFFKSSTGFMYLKSPFPNDLGTQFNFVLEIGIGTEIKVTEHSSFSVGYKYHHMSNGQFGDINPGVDSNMFYGAITIH